MIWSWTCEQSKTNAISACLSICLYACMNVWMYACMYVSMYVRMYGRPDLKRPVQYIYYMCIYIYNNYIYTKSIKKTRYTQTVCATKTICRWVCNLRCSNIHHPTPPGKRSCSHRKREAIKLPFWQHHRRFGTAAVLPGLSWRDLTTTGWMVLKPCK